MYNSNKPSVDELPSSAQLLRSTVIAIFAAAALLVTTVLPSEYGIDPTGAGRLLGLTEMGEIKTQLAEEAEVDRRLEAEAQIEAKPLAQMEVPSQSEEAPTAEVAPEADGQQSDNEEDVSEAPAETVPAATDLVEEQSAPDTKSDEISITLSPGQGAEIKLVMKGGAKARFEWTANGSVLNYDTHGNGGGQRISYEKGRAVPSDDGVLEAAFDGNHGWFWRNRTDEDVTMTLRTEGDYTEMKRVL